MYVAVVKLKTKLGDVAPGEVVQDAMNWKYPVILAHVNLGKMRWVEDGPTVLKKEKAPAPLKIVKPPKEVTPPVEAKVKCEAPDCGKEFKNARALKIHVTSKHTK